MVCRYLYDPVEPKFFIAGSRTGARALHRLLVSELVAITFLSGELGQGPTTANCVYLLAGVKGGGGPGPPGNRQPGLVICHDGVYARNASACCSRSITSRGAMQA